MQKNLKSYLTTSEFARLSRVSKETLFHYDEIGVFSPELRAENGYRYYSAIQIEAFEVIRTLKEIGMPLKEIKSYLNVRSPQNLIALLEREDKALQIKIAQLTKMHKLIKKKAELTRSAMNIDFTKIVITSCEKELYAVTYLGATKTEHAMMLKVAEHFNYLEKHKIFSPYAVGEILTVENARKNNFGYDDYLCYYTRIKHSIRGVETREKPAGKYLTAYHVGGYVGVGEAYNRLLTYADNSCLALEKYIYEDVILDELSTSGYDGYVLSISVKIAYV